jgi:two-component system chemotaxis sensor kinase CheA
MQVDMEYYRRQFYIEAREILESVNSDILKAEVDPENQDLLNSIFRGIHTIKGSAGGFELDTISDFAHHLENLLDCLRRGNLKLSPEIVDVVLAGVDHIEKMIKACEEGKAPEIDTSLVDRFKEFSCKDKQAKKIPDPEKEEKKENPSKTNPPSESSIPLEVKNTLRKFFSEGYNVFEVEVKYTEDEYTNGFDPLIFLNNLKANTTYFYAKTDISKIPPIETFDPFILYLKPVLYIATDLSADDIKDIAFDPSLIGIRDLSKVISPSAKESIPIEEIDREHLKEFMIDAVEAMETIEKNILEYEKKDSPDALNAIFRSIHTLKGDADYIGLSRFAKFTHSLESILEGLRSGNIKRTKELIDILLKALDVLQTTVNNFGIGEGYPAEIESVKNRIDNILNLPKESDEHEIKLSEDRSAVFLEQIMQFMDIIKMFDLNILDDVSSKHMTRALKNIKITSSSIGLHTLAKLAEAALLKIEEKNKEALGGLIKDIEAFVKGLLSGGTKKLGEILVEEGKITEKDVEEAISKQKHIGEILVEEGKIKTSDVEEALRKQEIIEIASQLKKEVRPEEAKTMRVDERKIDIFSNMVGELVVAKNTYEYLVTKLIHSNVDISLIRAFRDNLYQFSRLSRSLQEGVMSLRMIPIKTIFQKFSRVVRDISRRQGKLIDFITDGEDTEIDKKVADMLSDPLIHLIRNSCDHGIEMPEERRKKNKPEKGTVILKASQEGSNLIIKVIDDGRGINREKLYKKALSMGIPIKSPDDRGIFDLIFIPGFSTKDEVSEVSGRGVGMDVVKTAVESLSGKVSVASEEGWGTEITLAIPMSMGITLAILVEAEGKCYAIPIEYIIETLKIHPSNIKRIHHRYGIYYRGNIIPVESLTNLLYGREGALNIKDMEEEVPVVIIRSNSGKFGVLVDRLHRNMEIAIKPVPEYLSDIDMLSGVTIMGDGKVVLVLNPENMV